MKIVLFLLMIVGAIILSEKSSDKVDNSSKKDKVVAQVAKYSLKVEVKPSDATVFITNIKPKYEDNIKLSKGTYTIKVVKKGYITKIRDIHLQSNRDIFISLDREKVLKQKISNGTIWKDTQSGLSWQKNISKKTYSWRDAKKYCNNLDFAGYTNWKLPTKKELSSLMSKESYKNNKSHIGKTHIKKALLKSMQMEWQTFWSATESLNNTRNAWNIYFDYGSGEYYDKSNENYVRCILN